MSEPKPLFVDTNAFVALFDEDDRDYERANRVLDAIQEQSLSYGPLFTSRYVLSETATVLLYGVGTARQSTHSRRFVNPRHSTC